MKRYLLAIAIVSLTVALLPSSGNATGPFDTRLSPDRQIIHALNRLTFGPRPGDIDEVRKLGLNKWIALQLHPDQIPENPVLDARLKPLESLGLSVADIVKDYTPQPLAPPMMMQANVLARINAGLMQFLQTDTPDERAAVLKALDPDKRHQALGQLPPNILSTMSEEFKKEGEEARKAQQDELQKQARVRNPQLNDLLNPDQITAARSGNKDQLTALFAYLDPAKRTQVAALLANQNAQSLAELPELRRLARMQQQPRQVVSDDTKQAKVFRAIYSNRQLEEVLVDFWVNHFNVDINKNVQGTNGGQVPNIEHMLMGSYERDAIRPHVLGHFKDLLLATARHPAMLYYLDNWESMASDTFDVGPFAPVRGTVNGVPNSILPNSPFGQAAHGLNENYGREVMELHTLGLNGGYTQEDVINVARCFTGWTVRDLYNPEFVFAPFMHDSGEKTVLGHKIPANGGEQDGLQVVDILAHHPSTAKFISRELAQRFVADDPPQALIDRMAATFTKTDGDLRAVLETMFTSPEFLSEGAWQAKVKSPFEMVVSAARAMQTDVIDTFTLVQKIADLGEPLYGKTEPTGYPNTGDTWLSTAGIMGRMNFAASLASGLTPGVKINPSNLAGKDAPAIAHALLGRDPSPQTQAAIEQGMDRQESPTAVHRISGDRLTRLSKEVTTDMLTRRIFLRGSAIVMAGMGGVPTWLARAASVEGKRRKVLVAIFQRGAADGLNIIVPFADKRYRDLRPTLALPPPTRDHRGAEQHSPHSERPLHRPRRPIRAQFLDAALQSPVGQEAIGNRRGHRLARFDAVSLRMPGFHGIRHSRQDHLRQNRGRRMAESRAARAGPGDVAAARGSDEQRIAAHAAGRTRRHRRQRCAAVQHGQPGRRRHPSKHVLDQHGRAGGAHRQGRVRRHEVDSVHQPGPLQSARRRARRTPVWAGRRAGTQLAATGALDQSRRRS